MKKLSFFIIISVFVYFMTFIGDISLSLSIKNENKKDNIIETTQKNEDTIEHNENNNIQVINGPMTMYTADCKGCSGITSYGIDVRENIYYLDNEYGLVRIVAADPSLEYGSIIKISSDTINTLAIVLDTGSNIGFDKISYFDLLDNDHELVDNFGIQNANFEILRHDFN